MGTHSLPCVFGRVANITTIQRVCTLCQTGILQNEHHLVFECPAESLGQMEWPIWDHAAAIIPFMWPHGTGTIAQFIKECMDARGESSSQSPRWPKMMLNFLLSGKRRGEENRGEGDEPDVAKKIVT